MSGTSERSFGAWNINSRASSPWRRNACTLVAGIPPMFTGQWRLRSPLPGIARMVPSPTVSITQAVASRYDELVATSPQGSVFCMSWWLDAVAPGRWHAHEVEENGRVVAAWPTVVRRTRVGDVHTGAPLTPFLGPLLPPGEGARRRSRELKLVESLLERIGPFAHLEARCNPAFDYWTPLRWHGFAQTTNYTWRLPTSANSTRSSPASARTSAAMCA